MRKTIAAAFAVAMSTIALTACIPPADPSPTTTTAAPELMEPGCYAAGVEGVSDISYAGPVDQAGNAAVHPGSFDGTCSTEPITRTVIRAESQEAAEEKCPVIDPASNGALHLYPFFPGTASDAYFCPS